MGAGKTAVGKSLAERLKVPFTDLDDVIRERSGKDIPQIFKETGETGFRALETEALHAALSKPAPQVLALGGGAFALPGNREMIAQRGARTIFLQVQFDEAMRRCDAQGVKRPLLHGRDRATLQQLFLERQTAYSLAEWHIETSGKSVQEVTDEALALIARRPFGQEVKP